MEPTEKNREQKYEKKNIFIRTLRKRICVNAQVNHLRLKIHIQILQADLHTFYLRIVERIWFMIKVLSLW